MKTIIRRSYWCRLIFQWRFGSGITFGNKNFETGDSYLVGRSFDATWFDDDVIFADSPERRISGHQGVCTSTGSLWTLGKLYISRVASLNQRRISLWRFDEYSSNVNGRWMNCSKVVKGVIKDQKRKLHRFGRIKWLDPETYSTLNWKSDSSRSRIILEFRKAILTSRNSENKKGTHFHFTWKEQEIWSQISRKKWIIALTDYELDLQEGLWRQQAENLIETRGSLRYWDKNYWN